MSDPVGKTGTYTGRLSFPTLTHKQAVELMKRGSYPNTPDEQVSPSFQLLLNQVQFEKFVAQATEFLGQEISVSANKQKVILSDKEKADMLACITGDLTDQRYNSPLKPPSDKTLELAPDTVATLKVIGPKGGDIKVKAIVRSESEINPASDVIFTKPVILDIEETTHELYPGCVAKCTINLYAYYNGKNPGFSAGGSILVFSADDDRFGGGAAIDEDEMFLDD